MKKELKNLVSEKKKLENDLRLLLNSGNQTPSIRRIEEIISEKICQINNILTVCQKPLNCEQKRHIEPEEPEVNKLATMHQPLKCRDLSKMQKEYERLKAENLIHCPVDAFMKHFSRATSETEKIDLQISNEKKYILFLFWHKQGYADFFVTHEGEDLTDWLTMNPLVKKHFSITNKHKLKESQENHIYSRLEKGDYSILRKGAQ